MIFNASNGCKSFLSPNGVPLIGIRKFKGIELTSRFFKVKAISILSSHVSPPDELSKPRAELLTLVQIGSRRAAAKIQRVHHLPLQRLAQVLELAARPASPPVGAEVGCLAVVHVLASRHVQCLNHRREQAALVGGRAHQHAPVHPQRGQHVADVGAGHVKDLHGHAGPGHALGHGVHHLLGVAVHRAVEQRHPHLGRAGRIPGPLAI